MPTLDLASAAVDIAAAIRADAYRADDPTLAVEMPMVWLADAGDPVLGAIVGSARATASIHGRLRPRLSSNHASQQLTAFVVGASDRTSAARLLSMARHGRRGAALLGVASDRLFVLVVARTWVEGVAGFETTASLSRFVAPLADALHRHSGERVGRSLGSG